MYVLWFVMSWGIIQGGEDWSRQILVLSAAGNTQALLISQRSYTSFHISLVGWGKRKWPWERWSEADPLQFLIQSSPNILLGHLIRHISSSDQLGPSMRPNIYSPPSNYISYETLAGRLHRLLSINVGTDYHLSGFIFFQFCLVLH